eukprot:m.184225 g.184225  ORF g.184225 m.184225 type:complete len:69 (-) comp32181_c5_seq16:432-638(-)
MTMMMATTMIMTAWMISMMPMIKNDNGDIDHIGILTELMKTWRDVSSKDSSEVGKRFHTLFKTELGCV